jgi:hypothetical protein
MPLAAAGWRRRSSASSVQACQVCGRRRAGRESRAVRASRQGLHNEPGMVIDPRDDLDFLPVREVDAAHHIHLP